MKLAIVLFILAFLSTTSTHAQKTRYFNGGPGASYSVHNDAGLSSLPYEGFQYGGMFELEKQSDRNWNTFYLRLQGGPGLSPVEKSGNATRGFAELGYRHLYRTNLGGPKIDINLGPTVAAFADNILHNGYSNNFYHPVWDITIGLAGRANRNFYLFKRRFNAAFTIGLPLWGVSMRPDYAYKDPSGFYQYPDDWWQAVKESYFYTYPPKMIRVKTRMELTYYIKNKNAIGLVYDWNYTNLQAQSLDNVNNVESAAHGLYFVTKFNF